MRKGKLRLITIVLVFFLIVFYLLPLAFPNLKGILFTEKKLKLGLDLQGGMQVLLQVEADTTKLSSKEKEETVRTALEIIRNRIDQFGVSEPVIQRVGSDRISVQLPGIRDFSRAKNLIGKTALLEFKLVAESAKIAEAFLQLDDFLTENINEFDYIQTFLQDNPTEATTNLADDILEKEDSDTAQIEDSDAQTISTLSKLVNLEQNSGQLMVVQNNFKIVSQLLKEKRVIQNTLFGYRFFVGKKTAINNFEFYPIYLLEKETELTGNFLESASVKFGEAGNPLSPNKPYVALEFDKKGSDIFELITEQNIKRRLAIVLDDVVYIAPVIQDKIRGGAAQIYGDFTIEETQDLVIVLKAGNLPAPVSVLQESSTGPSLGADSIRQGFTAGLIGLLLILMFMIVYYKLSGLLSSIAVAVNILFIMAALTMFEATLTMPGIAGIILTIGMAVDASVLIFERIREELATGKTPYSAVDSGFNRAFITILDANITTLITASVLYQFGSGPIKGFAVTLSIGIIGSMFTSIVLTRAIFDNFVVKRAKKSISI